MTSLAARNRATAIGFLAILMWSALALLTVATGDVPPFQLSAIGFSIGGAVGVVWAAARGRLRALLQPPAVMLLGISGLFGYHFFYFTALRTAPAAEANLINYLWPLLIVLFSACLPGERLKAHHVLGAALGLFGTSLIIMDGGEADIGSGALVGYGAAFLCAFTWAVYSVLSRGVRNVPTEAVAGFCLAAAVLSIACHLLVEETVWPAGAGQWTALAALGIFPLGLAFYVWDHGVKRGDIQVLGAGSYAAPLLSTLALLLAGITRPTLSLAVAAVAITAGALAASRDLLLRSGRHLRPAADATPARMTREG